MYEDRDEQWRSGVGEGAQQPAGVAATGKDGGAGQFPAVFLHGAHTVDDDHLILGAGGRHIEDAHLFLQLFPVLLVLDGDAGQRRPLDALCIHGAHADAHVCVQQER